MLCLPTLARRPSVLSPQGLHLVRRLDGLPKLAANANLRVIVRAATRTICSSHDELAEIGSLVAGPVATKTVVIYNGVELADPLQAARRQALRLELRIPANAAAGAWVAALDEHKDPLTAIRAVKVARRAGSPVMLLVAGDGPLRPDVEREVDGDDGIRILGFTGDVERILGASDFFVLSSRREGLSFSLLEAMAHGLAPLVSDARANVEAVGDAGIVFPFGDVGTLAAALSRVARDAEQRAEMGRRARNRATEHFSADEMVRRTRDVYDEILADRVEQA